MKILDIVHFARCNLRMPTKDKAKEGNERTDTHTHTHTQGSLAK